jgi:hypothetical protein
MARKEMSFTDEMAAAFPERNPLPKTLRQALEFTENAAAYGRVAIAPAI